MTVKHPASTTIAVALLAALAACGASAPGDGVGASTGQSLPTSVQAQAEHSKATPPARPAATGVRLAKVGTFDQPLYVTAPPGDQHDVYVVEQRGRVRLVRDGKVRSAPFLDISSKVSCCGEQGLLGLAFDPDYARNRRFYVDYTDRSGDSQVVQYTAAGPTRANAGSARVVLRADQPEANHNGGQLAFGPDGKLYVGLGDGGGGGDRHGSIGNGQSLSTLLGKILRIEPRPGGGHRVPSDNPFAHRSGARGEIWSYGLRNPWRFSFDRRTGDLVIGDVGEGSVEEIDFAPRSRGGGKGVNYGWRVFEGNSRFTPGQRASGAVFPAFAYSHDTGGCSITGGYVVRDSSLSIAGRYVYGDYCLGRVYSIKLAPGKASGRRFTGVHVEGLTSFGEDGRGRVYVTSQGGAVSRIVAR